MEYSVLTYNINSYEKMHEIPQDIYESTKDYVEYVYVTDNKELTSSTWNVKYVENPYPEDPFYLCYMIRFNPFDYVSNDICVRIDGSMGIVNVLDPIVEAFENGEYDLGVMIHPSRNKMYDEYKAWVNQRGLKAESANFALQTMVNNGYDVAGYKGLYQFNFMIHRKNAFNIKFMEVTLDTLKKLAIDGERIHRVDQTIGSFVLNKFFWNERVMAVGQYICDGVFFDWYKHNSDIRMDCNDRDNITPYLFDKEVYLEYIVPNESSTRK